MTMAKMTMTTKMTTMTMKRAEAIYPNTIYGAPIMTVKRMTKNPKNPIKNIQVRRPVHRRPAQIRLVGRPVQVQGPDPDEVPEINRVGNDIAGKHVHDLGHGHHIRGPEIAVIVHHIIHALDLAVVLHRPITDDMRTANIAAENDSRSKVYFYKQIFIV